MFDGGGGEPHTAQETYPKVCEEECSVYYPLHLPASIELWQAAGAQPSPKVESQYNTHPCLMTATQFQLIHY